MSSSSSNNYFVYILESSDKRCTYVGATIDVERRLKQHNGILKGGAKYTSKKPSWNLNAYVKGFPTWNCALKFEWRLKQLTRKLMQQSNGFNNTPIERRQMALQELLSLEKSTLSAIPFSEYPNKLEVVNNFPVV